MSVPLEGAVSCGTVGSASFGPAAPAASTRTPSFEPSAIRLAGTGLGLALAPEDAQARGAALRHLDVAGGVALRGGAHGRASRSWCCRARRAPRSGSWPPRTGWRAPTRCWRETGFCELSSIVMRLSGRTLNTVPSAKWISAAAPEPVRTRSFCRSTTACVAGHPLERSRPLHLHAALDRREAGAGLDRGGRRRRGRRAADEEKPAERREQRRSPRRRGRGSCSSP